MIMESRSEHHKPDNIYGLQTDSRGQVLSLFVRQPFASALCDGLKSVEILSEDTEVRGNILICSTPTPDYPSAQGGCVIGIAELYAVKPVADLTAEDWEQTMVQYKERVRGGYAWMFRNQRRAVELPVLPSSDRVRYMEIDVDSVMLYPQFVYYDK